MRALDRPSPPRRQRGPFVAFLLMTGVAGLSFAPYDIHAQAARSSSTPTPELQKVKAALEKYQDPIVAVHDGYFSTLACVEYPMAGGAGQMPYPPGGMGVHFFNVGLVGAELDPFRPQVLLYEFDGDKLRLTAAEWFVPLSTGVKERPRLFGHPFDGPMEGHHPLMPLMLHHYDLHVWLWKPNPAGMFSATNPDLKCSDTGYLLAEEAPKRVSHR